jgi:adenine deaminase
MWRFQASQRLTKGWAYAPGAIARAYCHVHYHALIVGTSGEQMTVAADALTQMQGGVVVVAGGRVLARWRLPLRVYLQPILLPAPRKACKV